MSGQLSLAALEDMSPEAIMEADAAGRLATLKGQSAPVEPDPAPGPRFPGSADQFTQGTPDATRVPLTRDHLNTMSAAEIVAADNAGQLAQVRTGHDPAPHQITAARASSHLHR